ncbi:ZPR1-like protein [Mya arenaria]|uniref:ZPR1-like protein n=1 Tax=Mya arenaria TaxID=6604 RepID=A0ABY7E6D6_MYAAR|nr:ZPR1-like protein [Mya arenaria]
MASSVEHKKPLFRNINAEEDDPEVTEIESLCVNCEKQDLNRQFVQTDTATVSIPELDFEAPPNKGALTTVEGIIDRVIEGLNQDQILRRIQHPDDAAKIDTFIGKLEQLKTCQQPFHMVEEAPREDAPQEFHAKDEEVVIMALNCDACGLRDTEVKGGGGIESKGRKIILKITDVSDLSRDVLRSEMCCVNIPELDFSTEMSGSAGKFTTLEGLLDDLTTQLRATNPFMMGDSGQKDKISQIDEFCDKLDKIKSGENLDVHIVLDDMTGNSYLQGTAES